VVDFLARREIAGGESSPLRRCLFFRLAMPKIVALVKYARTGASSRVRFWNLAPELGRRGWEVEIVPFFSDNVLARFYRRKRHVVTAIVKSVLSRGRAVSRARNADICWIEKEVVYGMPDIFERALRPNLQRCVIDYDDGVFLSYRDAAMNVFGRAAKFARYAQKAGYITVGSQSLKSYFGGLGCNRLLKVPSTVDVASYPLHSHQSGCVVIGWIGTPVTVRFLELVRDVLQRLARQTRIQLHVVGATWQCEGLDVQSLPWSEHNEAAMVSRFDIGIMPLAEGPWERAKCGYKLIQYMAAGVAPLGSRIGENEYIISENVTGLLAHSSADWLSCLTRLCNDHALRTQLGRAAREKAAAEFDVRCSAAAMDHIFSQVLASQRHP
jgi:glycosyltransferase involved in cell wall biosynthesis